MNSKLSACAVFCTGYVFFLLLDFQVAVAVGNFYSNFSSANPLTVKVGYDYESTADPVTALAAFSLAEKRLRDDRVIPNWVRFDYFPKYNCDFINGMMNAIALHFVEKVDIYFGPLCDVACYGALSSVATKIATVAPYWNLALMDYSSSDATLSGDQYATFTRSSYSDVFMAQAIGNIVAYFGWQEFCVVQNTDPSCSSMVSNFLSVIQIMNNSPGVGNATLDLSATIDFTNLFSQRSTDVLNWIRSSCRIVVLCPGYDAHDARPFLLRAADQNMTTSEFVYLIPHRRSGTFSIRNFWVGSVNDGKDAQALETFKRVIVISQQNENPLETNKTALSQYLQQLQATMASAPLNHNVNQVNASSLIAYMQDGMYAYGMGLNRSIQQNANYKDGGSMSDLDASVSFDGVTGHVYIDSGGDREPNFSLLSLDSDMTLKPFLNISLNPADCWGWLDANFTVLMTKYWWTSDHNIPSDVPQCGFTGDHCPVDQQSIAAIVAPVVVALALITAVALITVYRIRQIALDRELFRMSWKIQRHEVHKIMKPKANRKGGSSDDEGASASASTSMDAMGSRSNASNSDASTMSSQLKSFTNDDGILLYRKAPFVGVGDYRDLRVAVKQIRQFQANYVFNKKDLLTLHSLKEMRHDNLNTFIGMVLNTSPGLVIWEYCLRGSLDDLLSNDHVELDMMFKSSLVRDLVRGTEYVHKSILNCHGAMSTSNCIVDGRWVLKLTDFGLHDVMKKVQLPGKSLNEVDEHLFNTQSLFGMAPEMLRQAFEQKSTSPTKESDIYGVAMVIFQVYTREQLFTNMAIPPSEIVRKIAYPGSGTTLRPKIPKAVGIDGGFIVLLNMCWDENPLSRPNIVSVKESIYALTKQYNANIIDHVIKLMEQYTENLEKTVEERTKELEAERQKADLLLREMLPSTVADELKAGRSVAPEFYDHASIFFSQIVDFANICRTSTPLEVVNLLNQLFFGFDNIAKQHEVYKVETIGDQYMVASGLPIRNPQKHAFEVASMAVLIRKFVMTDFNIPHRQQSDKLELRIGIHSGPVAAGVVGLAMPRFCIFGDTVNTAARMESSCAPMKIQASTQSKKCLEQFPEFLFESRGMIDVKGKGVVETYWLIDRIPVSKSTSEK